MPAFQRIDQDTFDGYDQASSTQKMEVGRFVRFKLDPPDGSLTVRLQEDVGYLEQTTTAGAPSYTLWGKRAGTSRMVAEDSGGKAVASVQVVVEDKPIGPWVGKLTSAAPEGGEGNSNNVASKPPAMIVVEIAEPAEIKEQATEKQLQFRDLKVHVAAECSLGTSHSFMMTPHTDGSVRVPVEDASRTGMLSFVRSEAGSRSRCAGIWKDDYDGKRIAVGSPAKIQISTRLRFSVMCIGACFLKLKTTTGEIDEALVDKLAAARVDDLWLVATIRPKKGEGDDFSGIEWANSFRPGGSPRKEYLQNLSAALAKRNIRLIIGYALVNLTVPREQWTAEDQKFHAYLDGWIRWIAKADDSALESHADAIVRFFDDQQIPIGGVGFDLEVDGLNGSHADKFGELFAKVSAALASRNGIVGYANAPFKKDGKGTFPSSSKAQPFRIAASAPNIVAWPMCYDDKTATSEKDVKESIACSLRPKGTNDGGGLHASQLQFALWCSKLGTDVTTRWCKEVLRPNKIGLMVYTMPFARAQDVTSRNLPDTQENRAKVSAQMQSDLLDRCKQWEAALNPEQLGINEPGKPLQIPNATTGGPTPWASPSPSGQS